VLPVSTTQCPSPSDRCAATRRLLSLGLLAVLVAVAPGCSSIKKLAVNKIGDALAVSGTAFSSDDDPELIKSAAPFGLKTMESLLAESPRHRGLLLAVTSGFTQYGYAFVQIEADELENQDLAKANEQRDRARRLYLRARNYGLRGLEVAHPGFTNALRLDPRQAVRQLKAKDVPQIYWTVAAWGSAVSQSKDHPDIVAEVPMLEALLDRALELNEAWNDGAIHGVLISYEMARPGVKGDASARARQHFERAMALSDGRQASPLVAFAESVCVQKQDLKEFEQLLNQALAIDLNSAPDNRLVNTIMQRRAKWLLARKADLFLIPETPETK
jgi:predicted anti-sigma-YlaC factor YlaD